MAELFNREMMAAVSLTSAEAAEFKKRATKHEFTDDASPLVLLVWIRDDRLIMVEGTRCKTDTNGDGDCHLCARRGGCPHR